MVKYTVYVCRDNSDVGIDDDQIEIGEVNDEQELGQIVVRTAIEMAKEYYIVVDKDD